MSQYHVFKQDNGKGWGILWQEAPGSSSAIVIAVDLPELIARAGLAEMREEERRGMSRRSGGQS